MKYQKLKKGKSELSKLSKNPSQEIRKKMVNSTQLTHTHTHTHTHTRMGIDRTILIKQIEYRKFMELNLFFKQD